MQVTHFTHSRSFCLLCMSVVKVYQFVCVCVSFPLELDDGMWDLIVSVPDHCLSFYFSIFSFSMSFFYKFSF